MYDKNGIKYREKEKKIEKTDADIIRRTKKWGWKASFQNICPDYTYKKIKQTKKKAKPKQK